MRRVLAILALVGFLVATGVYIFIYLFRAFRLAGPTVETTVQIWHGDPFARAILVSVFFLIGLVVLILVAMSLTSGRRPGTVTIRADLWGWLLERADGTNEPPERIVERAVASYRTRLEGTERA